MQPTDQLTKYIATRDKRLAKHTPWNPAQLLELFNELTSKGSVIVGGRASCGGSPDRTWLVFTAWNEVVAKAKKLGMHITETSIKQKNAWATVAGGFWYENEYRLVSAQEQEIAP